MSETMEKRSETAENPLGTQPIGKLLVKYSVPSIIALLVNSLYNIVDQVYIGNFVGELGNAATNIAYPLTILVISLALLFGLGGAAGFNLSLGKGDKEAAPYYLGNSAVMLAICGVVIMVITLLFLTPLLKAFGSPDDVLPYAQSYVGITAFGFPFYLFSAGCGHLIRADGRPRASMTCNLVGAIINVGLDTLFVAVLGYGIRGAALATIIGQIVAAMVALWYMFHVQTVELKRKHLRPQIEYIGQSARLGMAPCFNQLATMVVQITMNNSLRFFGGMSIYGEAIPIAVVGIITKVSMIYLSIIGGVGQAMQPISSFNYGAKKYDRVRSVVLRSFRFGLIVGVIAFLMFQIFPLQIISLFGEGSSQVYYDFAVRYFRIYLFFAFANFLPIMGSNFFTAIGKPIRGTILSLTRQIIFFLPLLLIFPRIFPILFGVDGIDGILYVGPVADALAITVGLVMVVRELRDLRRQMQELET
ncbi:MAG: MATE family efflux transporter [Lachnospiraceae bacterium]|nr:MATE family efflux transporter [Lachnospiraceae bacterium]